MVGESSARGLGDGGGLAGGHVAGQRPGAALAPGRRRPCLKVMVKPVGSGPARQIMEDTRKGVGGGAQRAATAPGQRPNGGRREPAKRGRGASLRRPVKRFTDK